MKRIIYDCGFKPDGLPVTKILKGIIIKDTNEFLVFKTANNEYQISKSKIIEISESNEVFKGDL